MITSEIFFTKNLQENKKLFWKLVKRTRQDKQEVSQVNCARKEEGSLLMERNGVLGRWKDYFSSLFSFEDREVGDSGRQNVEFSDANIEECVFGLNEVVKAVKDMKSGKAAGCDGIPAELIKYGGGLLLSCCATCLRSVRLRAECQEIGAKPSSSHCTRARDRERSAKTVVLIVVGKLYARFLIEVVNGTVKDQLWDVQAGFRKGRGCMDQVFSLRCIAEKTLAKGKTVLCGFMDSEKAFDRVVREMLRKVLSEYGVGYGVIRALKSLYDGCSACVRVGGDLTDWFFYLAGRQTGLCCVADLVQRVFGQLYERAER
ncbi:hypothetical protein ACNGQH_25085 [Escherichia coli]